jgi:ABC-2 type transport system permease protein
MSDGDSTRTAARRRDESRAARRSYHPLAALTESRILEFVREPEALFWVFAFPILMAVVLGFAFRDRPPEPVPVGVVAGPSSDRIADALTRAGTVRVVPCRDAAEGMQGLRTGKIALLVEGSGGIGPDRGLGLV